MQDISAKRILLVLCLWQWSQ